MAPLFVESWKRHARSSRMATPLLKTAHILLTKTDIAEVAAGERSLCCEVLDLARGEVNKCCDIGRLLDAASLISFLVGLPPCRAVASRAMMVLLLNKYPKVTAECQSSYCDFCVR